MTDEPAACHPSPPRAPLAPARPVDVAVHDDAGDEKGDAKDLKRSVGDENVRVVAVDFVHVLEHFGKVEGGSPMSRSTMMTSPTRQKLPTNERPTRSAVTAWWMTIPKGLAAEVDEEDKDEVGDVARKVEEVERDGKRSRREVRSTGPTTIPPRATTTTASPAGARPGGKHRVLNELRGALRKHARFASLLSNRSAIGLSKNVRIAYVAIKNPTVVWTIKEAATRRASLRATPPTVIPTRRKRPVALGGVVNITKYVYDDEKNEANNTRARKQKDI